MKKWALRLLVLSFTISSLNALLFSPIYASSGAIWTTDSSCGSSQQNINHYNTGDTVFIKGNGFKPDEYNWSIQGQPGGASGDPGKTVTGDSITVDASGTFCFAAYTILADDWGEYNVNVGNKGDNYSANSRPVNTVVPPTPTELTPTDTTITPTDTPVTPTVVTPTDTPVTPTDTPVTPTEVTPTDTPVTPTDTPVTPTEISSETMVPQPTVPPSETPLPNSTTVPSATPTEIPTILPTETLLPISTTAPTSTSPVFETPVQQATLPPTNTLIPSNGPTSVPQMAPVTGGPGNPSLLPSAAMLITLVCIGSYVLLKKKIE